MKFPSTCAALLLPLSLSLPLGAADPVKLVEENRRLELEIRPAGPIRRMPTKNLNGKIGISSASSHSSSRCLPKRGISRKEPPFTAVPW